MRIRSTTLESKISISIGYSPINWPISVKAHKLIHDTCTTVCTIWVQTSANQLTTINFSDFRV